MTDLVKRFEAAKAKVEEETRNVQRIEARLEVKKDEINRKKQELAERGVQFSTFSELQQLIQEKESRVLEMVEQMEQSLGIAGGSNESADDELFDEFVTDEDEFDFEGV